MYRRAIVWGAAFIAGLFLSVPGRAVPIITNAELYSDWSSPSNVTSIPLNFTGTQGVSLTLNGSGVATGFIDLVTFQSFNVNAGVTHEASGGVDDGEAATADHINSEVGTWDDAGIFSPEVDTNLNLDFNGDSPSFALFALPTLGLSTLIVAEDAGLDPMQMYWCEDAACTGGPSILFDGFEAGVLASLLGGPNFEGDDLNEDDVDQAYVFNFQAPAKGFLGFQRNGNPAGEDLEIDFVGGVTAVPEPGTMFLVGTGLLGLATWKRRRAQA